MEQDRSAHVGLKVITLQYVGFFKAVEGIPIITFRGLADAPQFPKLSITKLRVLGALFEKMIFEMCSGVCKLPSSYGGSHERPTGVGKERVAAQNLIKLSDRLESSGWYFGQRQ